jgi:hypothetical protein
MAATKPLYCELRARRLLRRLPTTNDIPTSLQSIFLLLAMTNESECLSLRWS